MFEAAIANFRPRPRMRTLDWSRRNVQTAEGRPYDHNAYPHMGAPGGPFDAFDCPQYRTISEQFGSQVGKTFGVHCCLMKTADCDPSPMMAVLPDQKLAVEEITMKVYPMLERCPPLRDQLRPPRLRKQDLVALGTCRIYVGWARSVSTLASKAVRVGYGGEVDKYEHTKTSKEADPLELFKDRFKSYPNHKIIFESTPALKSASRIERLRLASFNAFFWVPCPHCSRYQILRMGKRKANSEELEPGGLQWDKNEAGKSDKDLARRTARYVCVHCGEACRDEHRGAMMRNGVWVPEGCGVDDVKARAAAENWRQFDRQPWRGWSLSDWITGIPARDGRDAGYHLSSLYALSLTWGDIAAKFVESKDKPHNLRNFVNQWLAETWEHIKRRSTWEQVGERLIDKNLKRFEIPAWASMLTLGVDRQSAGGDRFPWVITAWGPERRHAIIAYGEGESPDDIEQGLYGRTYNYADGGGSLNIAFGLGDSGHRPDGMYELSARCFRKGFQFWPCKGSSQVLESDYKQATLGPNTSMPGMVLFHVDTIRSQLWLDKVLHSLKAEDAGGGCLHSGSLMEHQDFLEQVLNDAAVEELDARNNARESWDRINTNIPNDFRDAWRYAYVAMLIATRNAPIQPRASVVVPKKSAVVAPGIGSRSGGSWL